MTVIFEIGPDERFQVESWSRADKEWRECEGKSYKTAEDAIAAAKRIKENRPRGRFRVVDKGENR